MVEVEVWICVDSSGDSAVGSSAEDAKERYEESIQQLAEADGFRLVKLLVKVPLPEVVELLADAPALCGASLALVA